MSIIENDYMEMKRSKTSMTPLSPWCYQAIVHKVYIYSKDLLEEFPSLTKQQICTRVAGYLSVINCKIEFIL